MRLKILSTIAALTLISTSVYSQENRNKTLDRMMYTINPNIAIKGPVYSDVSDAATKTKYASDIVRLILKEADAKASRYAEAGDFQAYYAFLTLGLTVPLHEGLYLQFRTAQGAGVCVPATQNGDLVKQAGDETYKMFVQYFKTVERPFIPACEAIAGDKYTQIIRGGDGSDLSIMQVSIRWHFDDFLANKKYEDVSRTLNYGMGHIMNGFNPVYRNIDNYSCLVTGGLFKKKRIDYVKLVRGVWAGKYNSGNIAQTCRFADPSSPYQKNDAGFEKNLNKILSFNGNLVIDLVGDFKLDQASSDAIKEIVSNLRNNTNNRTALDKLIK